MFITYIRMFFICLYSRNLITQIKVNNPKRDTFVRYYLCAFWNHYPITLKSLFLVNLNREKDSDFLTASAHM